MKTEKRDFDVTITLSVGELGFICNAINEALESVEDWEFQTRTGKNRPEATAIHARLRQILDDASQM